MKRVVKILAAIILFYLVIMLASGLAVKALLSGAGVQKLLTSINERSPAKVSAGEGSFDLLQWFCFRPVVSLNGVSVANPTGFSARPLLTAERVEIQVALLSILRKDFEIVRVRLNAPTVNIEINAKGVTNASLLLAGFSGSGESAAPGTPQESGPSSGGVAIRSLSIESGTFRYAGADVQGGITLRNINLSLTDFSSDSTLRVKLTAALFGGRSSKLIFDGHGGPLRSDSMPAAGNLTVTLAPADMPADVRKAYFGDLLRDPGNSSKATLNAYISGDAAKTLKGEGKFEITGFQLGPEPGRQLGLNGQAPLAVVVNKAATNPSFELRVSSASLNLGQGQCRGSLSARFDGSRTQGESRGAITGVRIEELLSAFSSSKNTLSGRADISEYSLQFSGANADQIRASLAGSGTIRLTEGRVAMFDLLGSIESKIRNVLAGGGGSAGSTDFATLDSRFDIRNNQLLLSDILLEAPAASVTGKGTVGFDHSLEFDLDAAIAGGLASKLGAKPEAKGQTGIKVPVKVRGTLESAKVYPDVAGMVKEKVVERTKGLLDSFVKKRTNGDAK
jgi:uncharacterized protein involved in outer membrane biogenesis